jgi:hypothetical protein
MHWRMEIETNAKERKDYRERLSLTCGHIKNNQVVGPYHKTGRRSCAARTSLYRLVYLAKWGAAHPLPPCPSKLRCPFTHPNKTKKCTRPGFEGLRNQWKILDRWIQWKTLAPFHIISLKNWS